MLTHQARPPKDASCKVALRSTWSHAALDRSNSWNIRPFGGLATMTSENELDSQKAEAFAGKLLGALNQGALCLMLSVGHRTGLLDAMRDLPATTAEDLARTTGLRERYVREWLGALVTSGVVEFDP